MDAGYARSDNGLWPPLTEWMRKLGRTAGNAAVRPLPVLGQGVAKKMTCTNLAQCIDRGRERRVTLNCDALIVEADGCTTCVTLVDVTQVGFRLRSEADFELDREVLLQMPKAPAVRAMIRWICGHEAGGVFLDPIVI